MTTMQGYYRNHTHGAQIVKKQSNAGEGIAQGVIDRGRSARALQHGSPRDINGTKAIPQTLDSVGIRRKANKKNQQREKEREREGKGRVEKGMFVCVVVSSRVSPRPRTWEEEVRSFISS